MVRSVVMWMLDAVRSTCGWALGAGLRCVLLQLPYGHRLLGNTLLYIATGAEHNKRIGAAVFMWQMWLPDVEPFWYSLHNMLRREALLMGEWGDNYRPPTARWHLDPRVDPYGWKRMNMRGVYAVGYPIWKVYCPGRIRIRNGRLG